MFNASGSVSTLNVTDGSGNTIIGEGAGNATISGTNNTGLGLDCMTALTTGSNNVAIGYFTLNTSNSDSGNTGLGWGSLTFLNGGSNNTAVGFQSMNGSGSGSNNTALGVNSLLSVGTANQNTAIGGSALETLTGGTNNVALGYESMLDATGSFYNTAIGTLSLNQILTGQYNTALGYIAGGNYTGSETSNICINAQGVVGDNNILRIGDTTGGGFNGINAAYIQGIHNNTQTGSAVTINPSTGRVGVAGGIITAPVDSHTATIGFGTSLTAGTSIQNTLGYDVLVNISVSASSATGATVVLGIGPTNTPTTDAVNASFTAVSFAPITFTAIVPNTYWLLVNTTGTITVSSITTQVCPL